MVPAIIRFTTAKLSVLIRTWKSTILIALIILLYQSLRQSQTSVFHIGAFWGVRSSSNSPTWHGWSNVESIFVFGDSYTTTDFDIKGQQPSPAQPLGNPPYPKSESVYGSTWPLYLTMRYNDSLIQTYNFADFGATVDRDIVAGPDFTHMLADKFLPTYVQYGKNGSGWDSRNSLFTSWFGINEIDHSMYEQVIGEEYEARLKLVFQKYNTNLEMLYSVGARNFLLLNVPSLELAPVGQLGNPYWHQAVVSFNAHVAQLALQFTSTHSDVTLFEFDAYGLFTAVFDSPAAFPQTSVYKNTTGVCLAYAGHPEKKDAFNKNCGLRIQEYMWHDALHPTYPIQDALAHEIAKILRGS